MSVWDDRLVVAGTELHRRRREYAMALAAQLGEVGRVLFKEGREVRLRYRPSPVESRDQELSRFSDVFSDALQRGREKELALGYTFRGPHRDDVAVELDEMDLIRFGSAGQLRASMVALKLGKLSLVRSELGEAPLFLMDDFDSDLDEIRASDLAGYLNQAGFQAVVATSKEAMSERLGVPFARVKINDGVAEAA